MKCPNCLNKIRKRTQCVCGHPKINKYDRVVYTSGRIQVCNHFQCQYPLWHWTKPLIVGTVKLVEWITECCSREKFYWVIEVLWDNGYTGKFDPEDLEFYNVRKHGQNRDGKGRRCK